MLSEPSIKILTVSPEGAQLIGAASELGLGVYGRAFAAACLRAMERIAILNRCHSFGGFVYQHAHFSADKKPGYDQLAERRFEFIPLCGFFVSPGLPD